MINMDGLDIFLTLGMAAFFMLIVAIPCLIAIATPWVSFGEWFAWVCGAGFVAGWAFGKWGMR